MARTSNPFITGAGAGCVRLEAPLVAGVESLGAIGFRAGTAALIYDGAVDSGLLLALSVLSLESV